MPTMLGFCANCSFNPQADAIQDETPDIASSQMIVLTADQHWCRKYTPGSKSSLQAKKLTSRSHESR